MTLFLDGARSDAEVRRHLQLLTLKVMWFVQLMS